LGLLINQQYSASNTKDTAMVSEKHNVLIVDDEPKLLELLKTILAKISIEVFTALSGEKALNHMAASPEMAVIVSNYHMGGMTGGDFLDLAKNQSPRSTRILMTAGLGEDALFEMKDDGLIHSFSKKPIIVDSFVSQVNNGISLYLNNK
jgi:DNA-binding NtrC family response regulator